MEKQKSIGKEPPLYRTNQRVKFREEHKWSIIQKHNVGNSEAEFIIVKQRRSKISGKMIYGLKYERFNPPLDPKLLQYASTYLTKNNYMVKEDAIEPLFDINALFANLDKLGSKIVKNGTSK